MPLQTNLQFLKAHYREFLKKTAAYNRSEGSDACAHHYYVERACAEATLDNSFDKLTLLLTTVQFSQLRAYYHARKERAKERLRHAIDAKVSRLNQYLASANSGESTSRTISSNAAANSGASELTLRSQIGATGSADAATTSGHANADLDEILGADGFLRRAVLYLVGSAARTYMTGLNTTRVDGLTHIAAALQRPNGQALITVSNHVAALDDPLVVSALLPEGTLEQPKSLRWTLCASDRCFRYAALIPLFRAAKVLPVVRGGGLTQPGMAAAEARLGAGDWVHIFPEGTRSPDGVTLGAVRKGVGRLVAAAAEGGGQPPLVVPFVHRGMEAVMPRGAVLPAVGQQIDVLVGEPIPVADLIATAREQHWSPDRLHTAVAARVANGLKHLRQRLDATRAGLPDPGPEPQPSYDDGTGGGNGAVSSLDQFDPTDLALAAQVQSARRGGPGAVSAAWERLKFRTALEYGSWAARGMVVAETRTGTAVELGRGVGSAAGGEGSWAAAGRPETLLAGGGSLGGCGGGVGEGMGTGLSPYLFQLVGLSQPPREAGAGSRGPGWALTAGFGP